MIEQPVFLLTGPSGSGKTTVCHILLREMPERLAKPVSVTTRVPRAGEVHGRDYYFVTEAEFALMERHWEFLETSIGNGQCYGLTKRELDKIVASGKTPLIVCDTEGVDNYHALGIPYRAVFLYAGHDTLACRILARGSIKGMELGKRLDRAEEENTWYKRRVEEGNTDIKLIRNLEYGLDETIIEVKQHFGLT